jgi:hypothetical protein
VKERREEMDQKWYFKDSRVRILWN